MLDIAADVTAESAGQAVVRVMPRLIRHLVAAMHAATEADGLTWPQFRVLCYLSERDLRASELADSLEIGRSTVTTIGDGLARRGLIARVRDLPDDRRGVLMRLTPEGRALHGVLKQRAVAGVVRLLAGTSPEDVEGLVKGLEAIERSLCALSSAETLETP